MGTRPVIIRFCDKCQKELIGRLTFRTCPCCGKDVCLACIEKENQKHRPRERKPKVEPSMTFKAKVEPFEVAVVAEGLSAKIDEQGISIIEPKKKRRRKAKIAPDNVTIHPETWPVVTTIPSPDISTFAISTPPPGKDEPSTLSISGVAVSCMTLKAGVEDLMATLGISREDIDKASDSEGKRDLLNILGDNPKTVSW